MVAVSGGPESSAADAAGRPDRLPDGRRRSGWPSTSAGATGSAAVAPDALERLRAAAEELGGTFHAVVADDVAEGLLDFARGVNATQVLIGASRRGRLADAAAARASARR